MKRMSLHGEPILSKLGSRFDPVLKVIEYVSTKKGDAERGPMVRLNSREARFRLLENGELVRVAGPRRQEFAVLLIDDSIPKGNVALRDVAGVTVSESVRVSKPDTDTPVSKRHFG